MRFLATDDPAAVENLPDDEAYVALCRALADDGFRPAGVVDERMWFHCHEWTHRAQVRKFRSADGRTFASLYQLRAAGPWRLALESVCEDGRLVQTAAPGVGLLQLTDRVIRTELGSVDVAAVHFRHCEVLLRVAAAGGPRPVEVSLAESAAVGERIDEANVRAPGDPTAFTLPAFTLLLPAAVVAAARLGVLAWMGEPAAPPAIEAGLALAGGLGPYLAVVWVLFPALFAQTEVCDANSRDDNLPADFDEQLARHFRRHAAVG